MVSKHNQRNCTYTLQIILSLKKEDEVGVVNPLPCTQLHMEEKEQLLFDSPLVLFFSAD